MLSAERGHLLPSASALIAQRSALDLGLNAVGTTSTTCLRLDDFLSASKWRMPVRVHGETWAIVRAGFESPTQATEQKPLTTLVAVCYSE